MIYGWKLYLKSNNQTADADSGKLGRASAALGIAAAPVDYKLNLNCESVSARG